MCCATRSGCAPRKDVGMGSQCGAIVAAGALSWRARWGAKPEASRSSGRPHGAHALPSVLKLVLENEPRTTAAACP
eukprot:scaffold43722_cov140-Isochrysis_galbana.AAC.1